MACQRSFLGVGNLTRYTQRHALRDWRLEHQAAPAPCTCGVHGALGSLLDVLQELGLGGARVPQQQHVDVAAQPVGACRRLLLQEHGGKDFETTACSSHPGACAHMPMLQCNAAPPATFLQSNRGLQALLDPQTLLVAWRPAAMHMHR